MSVEQRYQQWLEGKISLEDLKASGVDIDENLGRMITLAGELELPEQDNKAQAWEKLNAGIAKENSQNIGNVDPNKLDVQKKEEKIIWLSTRKLSLGIAASLALIFVVYTLFIKPVNLVFETGNGEIKEHSLPDGSTVKLNAASSISYNKVNWEEDRTINLDGEAYFDVKKGSKFVVNSKMGKVSVLGTQFNIKERGQFYEVACFSGSVAVTLHDNSEVKTLSAGTATKIQKEQLLAPIGFKERDVAGWQSGIFYFENTKLDDVLNEFSRQYDVEIKVENDISDRFYSGHFKNGDMKGALDLICLPMNLTYTIENDKIIIE